jgi:hypothetical protein
MYHSDVSNITDINSCIKLGIFAGSEAADKDLSHRNNKEQKANHTHLLQVSCIYSTYILTYLCTSKTGTLSK